MKILFFASYPTLAIGYSRIANILTNHLASLGHDVYYFGISNFKNNLIDRYVHPSIHLIDALEEERALGKNELYGVNSICDWAEKIKPDILFLYNDVIVISRIFNNFAQRNLIRNFKTITYIDLVYPCEKLEILKHVNNYTDIFVVFSEYWKDNLIKMNICDENKIKILYHGFDTDLFFQIDSADAKKYYGFDSDDFVVLNTNRNSYRKCIDKTIDAFVKFLKIKNMNSKIKLFLNMMLGSDDGSGCGDYNIINCIEISCAKYNVDFEKVKKNHIFIKGSEKLEDLQQNFLYNASDVGINTCIGEGFGLCNLEHGGLGKPQIVSKTGGLSDIFSSSYAFVVEPQEQIYIPNNVDFHGGYMTIFSTDDYVNGLIKYYDDVELRKTHGEHCSNLIKNKYNWKIILDHLADIIDDVY